MTSALKQKNVKILTPFQISDVFFTFFCIVASFVSIQHIPFKYFFEILSLPKSIKVFLAFVIQELIFLLPVFLLLFIRYKKNVVKSFSIHSFPIRKGLKNIIKWYLLYLLFSIIVSIILLSFHIEIPGYGPGENLIPLFGNDEYSLLIFALIAIIIAPLVEELFFRGFVFMTLLKKYNYLLSTIITAAIFASIHFDFAAFIPRFLLGLILNHLVIENNRSIIPSFLFHVMNNGIAFIVIFYL